MIQLHNITYDLGNRVLFNSVNGIISQRDKIGLIGRNGAGKSTFLKILARIIKPSSGHLTFAKDIRVVYLSQVDDFHSSQTVFEEAFQVFSHLTQIEEELTQLEKIVLAGLADDKQLDRYLMLQETPVSKNIYHALEKTEKVLTGLGFTEIVKKKKVDELSVGWKMRLLLAKALLEESDVLLLDEPTNHLDIVVQEWLLKYMASMNQAIVLVSHDQVYLQKICTSILEIEHSKGVFYKGNLGQYLTEKERLRETLIATRARQEREIEEKKQIAAKFKASASRSQQAKNIERKISQIELVEIPPLLPTIKFNFPAPEKSGETVLAFSNISYAFGETKIFQNIKGVISRYERVALFAANGVGKTTLINCLAGKYKIATGKIELGHNVKVAFFEQEQARTLNHEKTIFQEIYDSVEKASDAEILQLLGSFQFSGQDAHKKISVLSGGEKNRVAMVKILLQRANFLILDEPTNHLDMYSKDILCQALLSYKGTILFVSHDINFVSKLATRIIELSLQRASSFPGNYEDFCYAKNLAK